MPMVIAAAASDVRQSARGVPSRLHIRRGRQLYINPGECIDCGAASLPLPVQAIARDRGACGPEEFVGPTNARLF